MVRTRQFGTLERMEKSIYTTEYVLFLARMHEERRAARFTQQDSDDRLGQTQSFMSKCERGERRLDIVELRAFCRAIGLPFARFVREIEKAIDE